MEDKKLSILPILILILTGLFSFPWFTRAASPDWTVTMYRWDDMSGVMPRTGTINAGESVTIRYNLEGSPKNSQGLFLNVTCVVSDSTGGSWVFSGQPNTVNSQLMSQAFVYYPTENTTYSFRCQLENDATDFAESTPPIAIAVNGGTSGGGFTCTGTAPWLISSYTDIYPGDGDESALTEDTPWLFASSNTNRLCEFHCQPGSQWVEGRNGYTCTPPGGGDPVGGGDPTATVSLVASDTAARPGQSVTLNWNTQGTTTCTIFAIAVTSTGSSYAVPGFPTTFSVAQSGASGQMTATPEGESTNYSLSCLDTMNVHHDSIPWNVRIWDAPQVDFHVKSGMATINAGQSSVLQWTVSSVSKGCAIYKSAIALGNEVGGVISAGNNNLSGEYTVSPTATTDYIMSCAQATTTPPFELVVRKTAKVTVNGSSSNGSPTGGGSNGGGCTPSTVCAATTCIGYTCYSCGTQIPGTMNCSNGAAAAPTASASLVPCGRNQDDSTTPDIDETKPCTMCHIIIGGQRIIGWGMKIMTVIALTIILAMGVLYIVSAGDQGLMQTAKGGLTAAFVGFAVMLLAWLIVNVVITVLADTASSDKPFANLVSTPGVFNFACDITSNVNGQ